MFGFEILSLGTMAILASSRPECIMPQRTRINVVPRTEKVKFDFNQSLAQIQSHETDTIDPHSFGGSSVMQGYMNGSIKVAPRVKLGTKTWPSLGAGCVWYDVIDVGLEIDPTIVIAKEVARDRCMKNAVVEHEMKHVNVDRAIVNEYAQTMGRKIFDALSERGFKSEVVRLSSMDAVVQRMQDTVFQVVDLEYRKMELDRLERQRAIDSREEYERVSNLCEGFKRPLQ